jgi:hypothetical protein
MAVKDLLTVRWRTANAAAAVADVAGGGWTPARELHVSTGELGGAEQSAEGMEQFRTFGGDDRPRAEDRRVDLRALASI